MLSEDGRDQEEQRAAGGSGSHLESLELLWAHRSHSPRIHAQVTRPLECLFCALGSSQTVLRVLSKRESHLARRLAVPMQGQQSPCSPGRCGHPGAGRGCRSLLGNSPLALSAGCLHSPTLTALGPCVTWVLGRVPSTPEPSCLEGRLKLCGRGLHPRGQTWAWSQECCPGF